MRLVPMLTMLAALPFALAAAPPPQVVELYQSQGCSSCPPANAVLSRIADRPDVLALNFAVTYWDRLGWKDSFAQPAFTRRQWDYANAAHRTQVYTPQMVINGSGAIVGGDPRQVDAALQRYARRGGEPAISRERRSVVVGAGKSAGRSIVWLVRYDPRIQQVPISAGENGGRTLPHRNIVRSLVPLGGWRGSSARFMLPAITDAALRSAVLIQQGKGSPIIAAGRIG